MWSRKPAWRAVSLACLSLGWLAIAVPAAAAAPVAAAAARTSAATVASGTFVKAYSAIVSGSAVSVSPVGVQATSDGGSITLSQTETAQGLGVDWLAKLGPAGAPGWAEEVGCTGAKVAPGDYADGVSVQQTADGGYIVVGSSTEPSQEPGAVIYKLSSSGTVQWQEELKPAAGIPGAVFNSVQPTPAGGYIAAGNYYLRNSQGLPYGQVLVAAFGPDGTPSWQHGFGAVSQGMPQSDSDVISIIATTGGGYAVAGGWGNPALNGGNGARGALLLKLGPDGNLQWQRAYSGGVYEGTDIGAFSYALQQTPGGGYVLAGDEDIEQPEVTIEPWIAKVSQRGRLLWRHLYYQVYKPTGLPLSEDFSGAAMTGTGGFVADGPTENYARQQDELYVVQTGSSGNAGSCGDEHTATPLQAISPQLAATRPALPTRAASPRTAAAPVAATPTAITTQTDC